MLQRSGGFFAAGSHQLPRWLWGLLRQARVPQFGQHPELSSVLAARAQGQENAGVLRAEGKLLPLGFGQRVRLDRARGPVRT
jgi:hypothetical protein